MKATINGVAVEGTPEEVWALLQRADAQGTNLKPYQPMLDWHGPWWGVSPPHPYAETGTATTPDYLRYPHTFSVDV